MGAQGSSPSPAGDEPVLDRNQLIAEVLPNYRRWLYRVAYNMLEQVPQRHRGIADHDDLAQEGFIAMWRAVASFDPTHGSLPSWLTKAASMRMRTLVRQMCQGRDAGGWTGRPSHSGTRSVAETGVVDEDSVPAQVLQGLTDVSEGIFEALAGVELAYHHGEIAEALASLTENQRRYVVLRYWYGLDPVCRAPGVVSLMKQFPFMSKRWLWTGSVRDGNGAQKRLQDRLGHLRGVV